MSFSFSLCNEVFPPTYLLKAVIFHDASLPLSFSLSVTLPHTCTQTKPHRPPHHPSNPPSCSTKMDWASSLSPHSASLWWLPSFSWACSDLLDIPLIYGSYIICSNIVHRATGCLLVSLCGYRTVTGQNRGLGERVGWVIDTVDGWMDKTWSYRVMRVWMCGHPLLQITCVHIYEPLVYWCECVLQIMRGPVLVLDCEDKRG